MVAKEDKRLLSVDWSARDTQGETLFKCPEGWMTGFKAHSPVTRIPLNQAGFSLARRRQRYCTNTTSLKKICLVLDLPTVTLEGEVAPVTGHFAFRTLRPRAPFKPDSLAVITEDTKKMEGLADRAPHSPSVDYFKGAGYPLEDQVTTSDSVAPMDMGWGLSGR